MKLLVLSLALCLVAGSASAQNILKAEPPIGSVKEGARVLIDDGSCPAGQIKEITGGNMQKRVRRGSRCIKRRR